MTCARRILEVPDPAPANYRLGLANTWREPQLGYKSYPATAAWQSPRGLDHLRSLPKEPLLQRKNRAFAAELAKANAAAAEADGATQVSWAAAEADGATQVSSAALDKAEEAMAEVRLLAMAEAGGATQVSSIVLDKAEEATAKVYDGQEFSDQAAAAGAALAASKAESNKLWRRYARAAKDHKSLAGHSKIGLEAQTDVATAAGKRSSKQTFQAEARAAWDATTAASSILWGTHAQAATAAVEAQADIANDASPGSRMQKTGAQAAAALAAAKEEYETLSHTYSQAATDIVKAQTDIANVQTDIANAAGLDRHLAVEAAQAELAAAEAEFFQAKEDEDKARKHRNEVLRRDAVRKMEKVKVSIVDAAIAGRSKAQAAMAGAPVKVAAARKAESKARP